MTANITYRDGTVEEREFTELWKALAWVEGRIADASYADARTHPSGRLVVHPGNHIAVASVGDNHLTRQQST